MRLRYARRDRELGRVEVVREPLEDAEAQIRRAFSNRSVSQNGLLDVPLKRAMPLRVEHEMGRKSADVVLDAGTGSILPTTFEAAAVVAAKASARSIRSWSGAATRVQSQRL